MNSLQLTTAEINAFFGESDFRKYLLPVHADQWASHFVNPEEGGTSLTELVEHAISTIYTYLGNTVWDLATEFRKTGGDRDVKLLRYVSTLVNYDCSGRLSLRTNEDKGHYYDDYRDSINELKQISAGKLQAPIRTTDDKENPFFIFYNPYEDDVSLKNP
ncbi:MAG: hypothetical protein OXB93_01855 [Cytophagales bacterium]|nr:hypothetical protein [Cytophagales bacterium]